MTMLSSALTQALERSATRVAANFPALTLAPPWPVIPESERLQAAKQLCERLCCVPFYAKRAAEAARETGDEMTYWLSLQASQMTAHRR
jgi:hypothetical protein